MEVERSLAMKVAIPHWQQRVSPVLDTARQCYVITMEDGVEISRQDIELRGVSPLQRARELAALEIDVLICGAMSRSLEEALRISGVPVRPKTCGEISDLVQAIMEDRLDGEHFLMPGCCGRRRRTQGRRRGRAHGCRRE
jgi:predicted Fe-Mo cluster-binding NifX family protein